MTTNGAAGFDFLVGRWNVHNRKIRDNTDRECTEWIEFDARSEVVPILLGGGNLERMIVSDPPEGDAFEGVSLRIFDPAADTWSIWWSSTRSPGKLEIPVVGRFDGDAGLFDCDDLVAGRPVKTRFEWAAGQSPQWQQSFSYDDGISWSVNWVMSFSRLDAG